VTIRSGRTGLEVYAAPETEGDARPFGATEPPGSASLDQLRRRFAARSAHDAPLTSGQQQGRMAAWQKYLDQLWEPRS
jgi:hypothetical protein